MPDKRDLSDWLAPAGSAPEDQVNPVGRGEGYAGGGIDIAAEQPKVLTPEAVQTSEVVITMEVRRRLPRLPAYS
ncbi:hypothetical protein [Nonomuraea dietziae]|uniref:hypothetical protein n=1 Tax=Nonomuraea dietziae TaxID=65515 RepID=UPI0033D5BF6B